jgi:hypothetical protein
MVDGTTSAKQAGMTRILGSMLRAGGVGAAALALAASSTDGDRANSGWCPAGEQCADDTPEGLEFEGAQVSWFIGNGVATTAVGGWQTVRLTDKTTGLALALPFGAEATNRSAHTAYPDGGAQVNLAASAEGEGYLRITRVADGYLFDRLTVTSRPIASFEVRPTMATSWPGFDDGAWAVFAGGQTDLAVALYDADGGWLVDESMQLATPTPSTVVAWDAVRVSPPRGGTGTYLIAVSAGGGQVSDAASVDVVENVDVVSSWGPDGTHTVGSTAEACFLATTGGRDVFGAPWTFEITGPADPEPASEQLHERCLKVRLTGPGIVTIRGIADGRSATTTFTAISGARARTVAPWVSTRDLGDRAAASAD